MPCPLQMTDMLSEFQGKNYSENFFQERQNRKGNLQTNWGGRRRVSEIYVTAGSTRICPLVTVTLKPEKKSSRL